MVARHSRGRFASSIAGTAFLAISAGALGSGAVQAQTIQVGLALPEGLEVGEAINGMYERFAEEVEANSDMTVTISYGGALGSPADRLSQMRRGVIQMSDGADGNYAAIYDNIQVLNMPYLFPTEQVAWEVLDGPLGQEMAEEIREETGVRVLGWWESGGFKHFSANSPINEPGDLEGLTIRAMGPVFSIPIEAAGGSATSIAFNELYTALETGVANGQDNAISVFNMMSFYEVQDYLTLSGHTYAFGPLGINDDFFSGLSEEQQSVIEEAAAAAITYNRETARAMEADAIDMVRAEGVTLIELSDEEKGAFREVMQPAVIEWLEANISDPSWIDRALEAVEAASAN